MFNHDSEPTRMYVYGARPPSTSLELICDQMHAAHRYRNSLVELERERRRRVDEVLAVLSPTLHALEQRLAGVDAELERVYEAIHLARGVSRSRKAPPDLALQAHDLKRTRKPLYEERKALREQLFASDAWKARQAEIETWAREQSHARRAASGCYWGTYTHVEHSVSRSGPPPEFQSWDGDGHLAFQFQPRGGRGRGAARVKGQALSPADAFAGKDSRLRIDPLPTERLPQGIGNDGKPLHLASLKRTVVYIRIDTHERKPVWADIPVVLDRPLPPDSKIKWVHLLRRRVGTHNRWQVIFVLSRASGWESQDRASTGVVGIDVGWRLLPEGLRVAYYVGSDGVEGSLFLPPDWLAASRKTRELRSIRDKNFNTARAPLVAWLRSRGDALPPRLLEARGTLHLWRSTARLAGLVIRWRGERFDGDADAFAAIEAWRKQDKHLYDWECAQREKCQARRLDIYRNFAASTRRRYAHARIELLDLRKFHKLPAADESTPEGAMREHTRDACLSQLVQCLKESMSCTLVNARQTTMRCHVCGHAQDFARDNLMVACTQATCPSRGVPIDQDRRAALNLLASTEVLAQVP